MRSTAFGRLAIFWNVHSTMINFVGLSSMFHSGKCKRIFRQLQILRDLGKFLTFIKKKPMELSETLNDFRFCRQEKVGGYLSEMSDEDIKQFDEQCSI